MLLLSRTPDFFFLLLPFPSPPLLLPSPSLPSFPSHRLLSSSSSAPQKLSLSLVLSASPHHLCFNTHNILSPTFPPPFAPHSHSHTPILPLPLFFQLSRRGYLRLRIHKTRLRCVCFCYFPKNVAFTATLLAADPQFSHWPSERRFMWFSGDLSPGRGLRSHQQVFK